MKACLLALVVFFPLVCRPALLPVSRHGELVTYGLFAEEAMSLVVKDQNRAFLGLGGSFAIVQAPEWWGAPQLVIGVNVLSSFGTKASHAFEYGAESMDVRALLAVECFPPSLFNISLGLLHVSGHVLEGVAERDLLPPDLGEDGARMRITRDLDEKIRIGGTVRLFFKRAPEGRAINGDLFAEFFPWGADTREHRAEGAPFFAVGVEESGYRQMMVTAYLQAGVLFGNHFHSSPATALRLVAGYYHGADPRLKYFAFRDLRADFIYFGVLAMF